MPPLEVFNQGLHDLIAPDATIERIAGGLGFTEGPVWRADNLLFSDIPNTAYRALAPPAGGPGADHLRHGDIQWPDPGSPGPGAGSGARRALASPASRTTAPARSWRSGSKASGSTAPTTSWSSPMAPSTSPTHPTPSRPSTPGMPRPAGWWTAPIPGKELPYNGVYRLTPDGTLHLLVGRLLPCRTAWPFPPTSRSCTSTIRPTSIFGPLTCVRMAR